MGTRADFYVGKGKDAEWLGSIAYDGYPDGQPAGIVKATSEDEYRRLVNDLIESVDHGTLPEQGWPWPWEDSNTTDYAYAWDDGEVHASHFGSQWWRASDEEPEDMPDSEDVREFPNMDDRQSVTLGARSGFMVFGVWTDGVGNAAPGDVSDGERDDE